MATYNGAVYIGEQLSDLAAQTVLPAEVVICDDGSTDSTLARVEQFAAEAPFPVRIYRNADRLGYRPNFLKCTTLCRSDLIAFCDQDDRWLPEKLEAMARPFDNPEVLLAFHGAELIGLDERRLGPLTAMPRRPGLSSRLSGSPWDHALGFTQIFRRWLCQWDELWPQSLDQNFDAEPLAHDQWYFFLASALGCIVNVPEPLVRYRQHGANVFGWVPSAKGFRTRVRRRVAVASMATERRARSARQRAIILNLMAEKLEEPYRQRAQEGAKAYGDLSVRCEQRATIYQAPTFGGRIRGLASLLWGRGYGSGPWRFGPMALGMDLLVGLPALANRVVRGPLIKRAPSP